MKVKCPFCKVEYLIRKSDNREFQCAVCGFVWKEPSNNKKSKFWVFLLSVFVLLLAAFSLIALVLWMPEKSGPLSVRMDLAQPIEDSLVVSGVVKNVSEKLHGVPDLIVSLKDSSGTEIKSQKFPSPVPLLDAGETAHFSVNLDNVPTNVAKISVLLNQ